MPIEINAGKVKKIYAGVEKVKKVYVGDSRVYSAGNVVTYVVDTNITYQEEIDEGESILSPSSFTPSKAGWTFAGWRSDKTASTPLSSMVMGDAPVTLYAVFRQTITLSYNGNGSTSGGVAVQTGTRYYNNSAVSNPTFTISANGFARTGYSFKTWALGSASGTQYTAGTKITLASSTVMYALWYALNNGVVQSGCSISCSNQNRHSYAVAPGLNTEEGILIYRAYLHTNGKVPCTLTWTSSWLDTKGCNSIEIHPYAKTGGSGGFFANVRVYGRNGAGTATIANLTAGTTTTTKYTYNVSNYTSVYVQLFMSVTDAGANLHMYLGASSIRFY